MLEFRNVSKSFWTGKQRKVILDQASFRLERGQSLGILAPNGTGKTTLVNMMSGVEKPDEGEIVRTGNVSFSLGSITGVNGSLNAQENARFVAQLYGLDPDYVEAFCRYVCELDEYFEMPLTTYSSGMKSRFNLALMLSLEFDLYLIDEGMPTYLDAKFNRKAGAMLEDRLQTASLVLVSHDPATIETFCNSAAVLMNGKLTMCSSLEEARRLYDYRG
ncbi:MAG: ATP-binding cassette domain-containing protein [Pseudomonadota bacterium]